MSFPLDFIGGLGSLSLELRYDLVSKRQICFDVLYEYKALRLQQSIETVVKECRLGILKSIMGLGPQCERAIYKPQLPLLDLNLLGVLNSGH